MEKIKRPLNILVVEDNTGDFVLVEEFLLDEFELPEVVHATRFSKAEKLLKSSPDAFDAILLDLTLPDKNGEPLVDDILKLAVSTPVIVLTGYTDLDFSVLSLSKGVSDYLLKDDLSPPLLKKSILYGIERNAFSSKIRQSEKNYRDLFEMSPEPMMLIDMETYEFLDVNRAVIESYGYSKQEFLSMTLMDIKPDQEKESAKKIIQEIKGRVNIKLEGEHHHVKKNGAVILVEITDSSMQYKGRNAVIALARDVTEKRKEEERLKLLESVITNTTEAVAITEATPTTKTWRKVLYVNKGFTELTGYGSDEILGNSISILNGPETDQKKIENLRKALRNWKICEFEIVNYRKDGTPFWVYTTMVPVTDSSGSYTHWVAIGRNITDQKEYEKELKKSLREKDVLLAEIHHRVKNNLAVVSGMMQLQTYEEDDQAVQKKLNNSIFRIHTMATIHEILYQSGSFSRLHFSDIVEKLIDKIKSLSDKDCDINVNINKVPVQLNVNQAIPASLMLNEILTNIYKHAFIGRDKGKIDIDVNQKNKEIIIKIEDDGVGFSSYKEKDSKSLGLYLVEILTQQLQGQYKLYDTGSGTAFELRFKKSNIKGSGSSFID